MTTSVQCSQFNNLLIECIQSLRDCIPPEHEYHRKFGTYYNYYRKFIDSDKRVDFIEEFITYVSKYSQEIATCDEGLFSEEDVYYPNKPIQIFKGINFKIVWKMTQLTAEVKTQMWKQLQTLYVVGTYILKENDRLKGLMKKQQEIISEMVQTLKLEQEIKAKAKRQNDAEKKKLEDSGFNLDSLKELFGENNLITEMAMEIAMDLKLPAEKLSNPLEAIQLLFGHDGSKLQAIIEKVGLKLTEKIKSGLITEQQIADQAQKMNDNIKSKFKNIPGMPDISKFSQKVAEQVSQNVKLSKDNSNPNQKPSFADLTTMLKGTLTDMGLGNLDQFQSQFQQMMTEVQNEAQTETNPEEDAELDRNLAELQKNIN